MHILIQLSFKLLKLNYFKTIHILIKTEIMRHKLLFLGLIGLSLNVSAQTPKPEATTEAKPEIKSSISFSGYVKNDLFGDTRATVSAREGHFLLWPSAPSLDANGKDLNEANRLNMLPIQSRLTGKIVGPDALGAKTSGVIETDFFGQANDNINLLRMRHAFIKLKWENTELITGQYWNPLFVTSCFPTTLSFNSGTPFNSFARNPQIRVTHTAGNIQFIGAVLTQRDYASRGPIGVSYTYLSNAVIPNLHAQIHYTVKNEETKSSLLFGFGGESKQLVPRTINDAGEKVSETVNGMSAIVFAKITTEDITIKLQGRYGENNPDVLAPSGFAVKDSTNGSVLKYTPLTNQSIWADIHSNGKTWNVGVFAGLYKNLGTKDAMTSTNNAVYGLTTNIESLYRFSPRITYTSGKFTVGGEIEYTGALYGDAGSFDTNYIPSSTTEVTNTRVLLTTIYKF